MDKFEIFVPRAICTGHIVCQMEDKQMEQFHLKPFSDNPDICVSVPGSKSMTNRALLLAALADGTSRLDGVLFSDDSRVFMRALQAVGFDVEIDEGKKAVRICGCGGEIPAKSGSVYVGSAGTAARFLTAMLALSGGSYEITSSEQMKKRPMRPLLEALEQLGANFEYREKPYAFPFAIKGRKPAACRKVFLNIDESSQFLSALLLSGVMVKDGFAIELTGKRDARAYVEITTEMMRQFGANVQKPGGQEYRIPPQSGYRAREYQIEPDVSAACYFYAMAAIHGGSAIVRNVDFSNSQGDMAFLGALEQMGCRLAETEDGVLLRAPDNQKLKGITINMSNFSDQTMTLAAAAVFAEGETVIDGVGHIRRQESDRIHGIAAELNRMGIFCEERENGLRIVPDSDVLAEYEEGKRSVTFRTYEDHRMAMALAVIGTRIPGITIDNPLCCRKTFENYFEVLTNLDLSLE